MLGVGEWDLFTLGSREVLGGVIAGGRTLDVDGSWDRSLFTIGFRGFCVGYTLTISSMSTRESSMKFLL